MYEQPLALSVMNDTTPTFVSLLTIFVSFLTIAKRFFSIQKGDRKAVERRGKERTRKERKRYVYSKLTYFNKLNPRLLAHDYWVFFHL